MSTTYLTKGTLKSHTTRRHTVQPRRDNHTIVQTTYRDAPMWPTSLQWLHQLQIKPTPLTGNIWAKLNHQRKFEVTTILTHIIDWLLEATNPHPYAVDMPSHYTQPTAFWKLLITIEHLLLYPLNATDSSSNINRAIGARIRLFRQGRLQLLHRNSNDAQLKPINADQPITFASDSDPCPAAQHMADDDNYRAAYQRVQSNLPLAPMTPPTVANCQHLYPPKRPSPRQNTMHTRTHTRHPQNPASADTPLGIQISPEDVQRGLSKIKPGTAHGPFLDHVDMWKHLALTTDSSQPTHRPNLQRFTNVIQLLLSGSVPPSISTHIRACRFLALHKDPNNLAKLRPIGIGTAWRRLAGAVITTKLAPALAAKLTPQGQFGIAVKGGMDFIVHHALASYDRHIQQRTSQNAPPDRAFLFLDLTNMFNEVSREEARHQIQTTPSLQPLLPYFDLMYGSSNECYYTTPDGTISSFSQHEGFPQGDPLSPALAALVLHTVLEQCNNNLTQRATARRQTMRGDDNKGSHAASLSYLDDTSLCLAYEDITPYLQDIVTIGLPYGIKLNKTKTKLLTTDQLHLHTPAQQQFLQQALSLLSPDAHVTSGLRFLGNPIGTTAFRQNYIAAARDKLQTNTKRLFQRLQDPQTAMTLFKVCTIPSYRHLLAADILANDDDDAPPQPTWNTPLTTAIRNTTEYALRTASGTPEHIPAHSLQIAAQAVSKGGLGLTDPRTQALPATFIPLLRSIHFALNGDPAANIPKPPTIYTRIFQAWATGRNPPQPIKQLQRYLPTLASTLQQTYNLSDLPTAQEILHKACQPGVQHALSTTLATNAIVQTRSNPTLPDEVDTVFQSLLTPITSLPLHSLSRRYPSNRLTAPLYTTALKRKLRIPLYTQNTSPICPHCTRQIDQYGDHLFSCGFHKTALHNRIRDTIYTILRKIGPTIPDIIPSQHAVRKEPLGLIPECPTLRPADVAVTLTPTTNIPNTLAIDVTITPPPIPLSTPGRSSHQPRDINGAHLTCISRKFVGRSSPSITASETIKSLTTQGTTIFPFTVDPLGGLGYFAHRLLYHRSHRSPACPPPPDSSLTFASTNTHSLPALRKALDANPALASRADKAYSHYRRTIGRFASTNSSDTPSKWATQTLALNITFALATHVLKCQNEILAASSSPGPEPNILLPYIQHFPNPIQTRQPSTPCQLPNTNTAH